MSVATTHTEPIARPPGRLVDIPWRRVRPMPGQPRKHFDAGELRSLADSIAATGQVVAAQVKPVSGDPRHDYELIDGERRWRAVQLAGVETLRAEVVTGADAETCFARSVLANLSRVGHSPLEVSLACKRLCETRTKAQAAAVLGRSEGYVAQHLSLLDLHPDLFDLLGWDVPKDRRLPVSAAVKLAAYPKDRQLELYARMNETGRTPGRAAEMVLQWEPKPEARPSSPRPAWGRNKKPSDHVRVLLDRLSRFAADLEAFPVSQVQGLASNRPKDAAEMGRRLRRLAAAVADRLAVVEGGDR